MLGDVAVDRGDRRGGRRAPERGALGAVGLARAPHRLHQQPAAPGVRRDQLGDVVGEVPGQGPGEKHEPSGQSRADFNKRG